MSVEGRLRVGSGESRGQGSGRRDQATFDEASNGGVPLDVSEVHQRFGQTGDDWGFAQRIEAARVGGSVEQTQKAQDGQLTGPHLATLRQPFLIGTHYFESVAVGF